MSRRGLARRVPWGLPWTFERTQVALENGERSGSGVYLKSGLVITVAHLTAVDANMGVRIASVALAAKVLKQGSEDVDLSLLSIR
jgi:hypothetical protein